jgi:hypothetical protein
VTAESIDEAPARTSRAGRTTAPSSSTRRGASGRRAAAASTGTLTTVAGSTDTGSTDTHAGATGAEATDTGTTDTGTTDTGSTDTGLATAEPATTGSVGATASSVTGAPSGDAGVGSSAGLTSAGLASGGLSVVPVPADPPTTELRAPFPRPDAAAYGVADRVPVPGPLPSNIYRARRPGVAILLIIPAVAVGVLLVQALATSAFGDSFDIAGILASVCALVSLPFLVAGMYGLISGAAHGAEQYGFRVWARPPLAYLLVGLALVAAAGLAID